MEDRQSQPFTQDTLLKDLTACGVKQGQTLLVHCSLKAIGYVIGGS